MNGSVQTASKQRVQIVLREESATNLQPEETISTSGHRVSAAGRIPYSQVKFLASSGSPVPVMRVLGISAERAASTRESLPCCYDRIGRSSFFNPVHEGAEHVKAIERRSAPAVLHSGNQEDAAPFGNVIGAPVRCGQ